MRPIEDWADLMYLPGHATAHYVPFGQPYGLCGAQPLTLVGWFGTGSWDEREAAAQMGLCNECVARLPSATDIRLPA